MKLFKLTDKQVHQVLSALNYRRNALMRLNDEWQKYESDEPNPALAYRLDTYGQLMHIFTNEGMVLVKEKP